MTSLEVHKYHLVAWHRANYKCLNVLPIVLGTFPFLKKWINIITLPDDVREFFTSVVQKAVEVKGAMAEVTDLVIISRMFDFTVLYLRKSSI